jgi:pSer/pThr/pTyr-binding forkhead associated (FHA) protein/cytochrome c-type biogenesis protein CcmH/NrfG
VLKLIITQETGETTEQVFEESDEVSIGRAETNRIVTNTRRASRNHCRITHESGGWVIEDLGSQNGTQVNRNKITKKNLENGDEIRIADCRIVVALPGQNGDEAGPPDDKTVFYERPAVDSDATTFGLATPFSEDTSAASPLAKSKTPFGQRKLLIVVVILLVLFLMMVLLLKKGSDPPDPDSQLVEQETEKADAIEDLALNKKIKGYLAAGRELYNRGDYAKALSRFQMVLSVAPENQEAMEYVRRCQEMIIAEAAKEKELAERKQKLQTRVGELVDNARRAVTDESYQKAKDLLSEAIYLDPDNSSATELMRQVEAQMAKEDAQRAASAKRQQEKQAGINTKLQRGDAYYRQKRYSAALKEWESAVKLGMEGSDLYETQEKISKVQQLLAKSVESDYQKGMSHYQKRDYGQAAKYLQRVVTVLPDYKEARKNLAKAIAAAEESAQKLYQEGLVYEGIGQMDKARSKWEAVMKTIPLENNTYYQKAQQKLSRQ